MKIKKPDETIAPDPIQPEAEASASSEPASFTAVHDTDQGTVEFDFTDGSHVTLKEPKAKQFLLMQSWIRTAPQEYQSEEFGMIRLAHACLVKLGDRPLPGFDAFLETLESDDMLRLVSALQFFRDSFERFGRAATEFQRTGAAVHG